MEAIVKVPAPRNEPVLGYGPNSEERQRLSMALDELSAQDVEIPCVIGGRRVHTGRLGAVPVPHDHGLVLARFHAAGPAEVAAAVAAAESARAGWLALPWQERLAIFLSAAERLSGRHRMWINAATMLGQSKTCHQAEIDAACETADFWRFNAAYAAELYAQQPHSANGMWNQMQLRPLEGFVVAVTPFNFTAIGANLPTAPAMMGNTVIWKPAESQTLSAWVTYQILQEAGLPPGVINFLPGDGAAIVPPLVEDPNFAGLHFTGSTHVFRSIWKASAQNLERYRSFPRLVGETGGKDFILAHASADADALIAAIIRGAYEYQGQKCSAAARIYVPRPLWQSVRTRLADLVAALPMGDVRDWRVFMGAVINRRAFDRLSQALHEAHADPDIDVIAGGKADGHKGWFIEPTLLESRKPTGRFMQEELFGPIATVFVYDEGRYDDVLRLIDETSPYALTGALFAQDRHVIAHTKARLQFAAGNFYVNDKPTGAVVGQQPFGGSRGSGTNDKAGSAANLMRWVSPRVIKETFDPPRAYPYPFMV